MNLEVFELLGFGPNGWGLPLLKAVGITFAAALCGFLMGSLLGVCGAGLKLSRSTLLRAIGSFYTTVFRGVPEILIIYLFYFGGSAAFTKMMNLGGLPGFWSLPSFLIGAVAIAVISGAYQTEAFRAAFMRLDRGQLEAGSACGMPKLLLLRRIIAPQTLRFAMPSLGNIWQSAIKETALLSVIGLTELIRQAGLSAGSTREPLLFYTTAAVMYFVLGQGTGTVLSRAEVRLAKPWSR